MTTATVDANHPLRSVDPIEHAKAQNAKWAEQAKTEGNEPWGTIPEDAGYFSSYGWETAYDYERGIACSILSDVFKENNGFRPRGIYNVQAMTLAEIEAEIDRLSDLD